MPHTEEPSRSIGLTSAACHNQLFAVVRALDVCINLVLMLVIIIIL